MTPRSQPAPDRSTSERSPARPWSRTPTATPLSTRSAGDVQVRSANGDIRVDRAGADVDVKTSNGDVRVGEVVRGSVAIGTALGDLDIGIAEGTAAWLEMNTAFGHVRNQLDTASRPGRPTPRSRCAGGPPTATSLFDAPEALVNSWVKRVAWDSVMRARRSATSRTLATSRCYSTTPSSLTRR